MPDLSSTPPVEGQEPIFPPISKDHIQNCSYDVWFPKYRSSCIKSRIIQLPPAFTEYLLEDGIILADDDGQEEAEEEWQSTPSSNSRPRIEEVYSSDEEDDEPEPLPPNQRFPEIHQKIKDVIAELGGSVVPKLNWSAPKDAKWISPHQNTLKCTTPNDIYLLLKSSSFASHDLVHAFDGCAAAPLSKPHTPVLVLRPHFNPHVALEFRCFVKNRALIAISQRDINYYDFLEKLRPHLWVKITTFFREKLRHTFPDPNFVFDVYVPENSLEENGLGKVRLMDINPWAPRTDPLLFSWQEMLEMDVQRPLLGSVTTDIGAGGNEEHTSTETEDESELEYSPDIEPDLRILTKDDPGAFNFTSPQYSAHKLPKEVVDASMMGQEAMREFATQWRDFTEGRGAGMWEGQVPGSSN